MLNGFNVTYETVTEESAAHGDAAERGFLGQNMPLRAALELFNAERDWTHVESDSLPINPTNPPRWFTDSGEVQFASGDCRAVSLHLPDKISGYSAMRIARLVRCYGAAGMTRDPFADIRATLAAFNRGYITRGEMRESVELAADRIRETRR